MLLFLVVYGQDKTVMVMSLWRLILWVQDMRSYIKAGYGRHDLL